MVQYLMWRVFTEKNKSVSLSFMLAGHTKFSPDRFFGLIKKVYRRSSADTLHDLGRIVTESTTAGKNIPEYTCDTTTGQRNVTWYDWTTFLGQFFRNIPSITSYHHFLVADTDKGRVSTKHFSDSDGTSMNRSGNSVDPI